MQTLETEPITADAATAPLQLIRRVPLCSRLQISDVTLWRWIAAGKFPQPLKLGDRLLAWRLSDVEQWLAQRAG